MTATRMDYNVKPIGKTCAATGRELTPGGTVYSVLVEQQGQLTRLDFSEEGWTGPPPHSLGVWKCIVPPPTPAKSKLLDTESLMQTFELMCETPLPAQDKLRYVMALLLIQKRRLKLEQTLQDRDKIILQLLGSMGEGPFDVVDQRLSDDEVDQLQNDLNAFLHSAEAA
ncbi:MAG: hypothetical protein WEB58_05400 [Planctomycetaceae bacterium]